ncbi:MAG: Mce-associated rane protein [Frankiaceae bacterium]|jgi:Mce-associated membrane protein|nr:Mce-associated rane protein [Frankiaceae bacterium]MDQ1699774.1 Mce-associated rane protein [Frankiaceae bacterium]
MKRAVPVAVGVTAAVIAVGGGALATVQTHRLSDRAGVAAKVAEQNKALAAGRQIAVDFLAYDYRHIDADFTRVVTESTGALSKDFATQSASVRDLIVKSKAVSTAVVAKAGLVSASATSARVLVSVDRTVVNTSRPKGQTNAIDLQLDLVLQHGRWVASGVKPL